MAFSATCDPLDALAYATEYLSNWVYTGASYRSIWLNVPERSVYPKNVGTLATVFNIGDIEPTSTATGQWTAMRLSEVADQHSGILDTPAELCTNSWTDISWGYGALTYTPERSQLRGPVICREDHLFSHNPEQFLAAYLHKLSVRAQREWEKHYEYNHIRLSMKAIASADFTDQWYQQESLEGMECPDCELTQEMLEYVAYYLNEEGANEPDSQGFMDWGPDGPIYSLYVGQEISNRITRQNTLMQYRYMFGEPDTLLKRMGASKVIGNFRHIINQRPKRYTCEDGVFTEVAAYTNDAHAVKGTYQEINPAWRIAPYEGTDVISKQLFTSEIVQTTTASGLFDPSNSLGEWQFVKGAYKWDDCEDPLESKGRHYGVFMDAIRPNPIARFKWGWHIISKRCLGDTVECVDCSSD